MNEYARKHMEVKGSVLKCLTDVKSFLLKYNYENKVQVIDTLYSNLENGEFTMVIVGEFSAGKSTFLNALMGEKILPSYTSETTATVNFLKHKKKSQNGESGCVYYNDGTTKLIYDTSYKTISKYVSTNSDENVASNISRVELFIDSKFLENNITLIDSPGLNGIADKHREITQDQIEKSSASIFMFDGGQPGSKSDFDFLTELQKRVRTILYVLNKIDGIRKSEGETVEMVIQKLKEDYKAIYPDTPIPEIWPIAAYPALIARGTAKMDYHNKTTFSYEEKAVFERDSRLSEFEDRLWRFLTQGEKTRQELLSPVQKAIDMLDDVLKEKKSEYDACDGKYDASELSDIKIELEKQTIALRESLNSSTKDIKYKIMELEKEVKEEVVSESQSLKKRFTTRIDNWVEIEDIDPESIQKGINTAFKNIDNSALNTFRNGVIDILKDTQLQVAEDLNDKIEGTNIDIKINTIFNVPEFDSQIGIENFDKEVEKLEKELAEIEHKKNEVEQDYLNVRKLNKTKKEIEEKLEAKKQMRNNYEESSITCMPRVQTRTVHETKKEWRGGLFGLIGTLLVGKKSIDETREEKDCTERDHFTSQRDKMLKNYNSEINELNQMYIELSVGNSQNDEEIDLLRKQIEKKQYTKESQIKALQEQYSERIKKAGSKYLRERRIAVNDYVDDFAYEYTSELEKKFKTLRQATIQNIVDAVDNSVKSQLELKQFELERIEQKMASSVEEKESLKQAINNQIEDLKTLFEPLSQLEGTLLDMKIDEIKYDA